MTGHPANPNEATVQRAATVATQIADLRDELEQQTTRAAELESRLADAEQDIARLEFERGEAKFVLGEPLSDRPLHAIAIDALWARHVRLVAAIVVAAVLALLLVAGAFAAWWGNA